MKWYSEWRDQAFRCQRCNIEVLGSETTPNLDSWVRDLNCPQCGDCIDRLTCTEEDVLNYGSDEDKAKIRRNQADSAKHHSLRLNSADELPDLDGGPFTLFWKYVDDKSSAEQYFEFYCGEQFVWREAASFESWRRFIKVCEIFKQRYGDSFASVQLDAQSPYTLMGDDSSSSNSCSVVLKRLKVTAIGWPGT